MAKLIIIRHGQASFLSADYDNLSELGQRQATELGHYWLRHGTRIDRIIVGPRKRHQQTYEAAAAALEAEGAPLPEPETMAAFDEYSADTVMRAGMAQVIPEADHLHGAIQEFQNPKGNRERAFQKVFEYVTRAWVRGDLDIPKSESFQSFRKRVQDGIEAITDTTDSGETVAVFTSGGPVAASMGAILELPDEKTLEVSWMVRNGAFNEVLYSGRRRSLLSFANTPHLQHPELLTFR